MELGNCILISFIIISIYGLILKSNLMMFFIFLEINLLGVNLSFIFTSLYLEEISGIMVSIILLVIGAIETTIGLSLVMNYYNVIINTDLKLYDLKNLKG